MSRSFGRKKEQVSVDVNVEKEIAGIKLSGVRVVENNDLLENFTDLERYVDVSNNLSDLRYKIILQLLAQEKENRINSDVSIKEIICNKFYKAEACNNLFDEYRKLECSGSDKSSDCLSDW